MRLGPSAVYGVLDEPVVPVEGAPWVVLVNVAAEHHIGPGRRWVEWAREWAARGYRVVRIDQSGVGDSPTHDGQVENESFAPEWIDDMREVVQTLSPTVSRWSSWACAPAATRRSRPRSGRRSTASSR